MTFDSQPDVVELGARATELLATLRNAGPRATAALKPRPEDLAKVFAAEIVPAIVAHYAPLWSGVVEITARPDQTAVLAYVSLARDLRVTTTFPGGYQQLASRLVPDRVWIAWKYVTPGERIGMAYDGLVWIEDHFAWFPKPWRALDRRSEASDPTNPFYVD
jgi:hypothetical protein